jgi:diguanylate cyclase (GGDEF)-like protein
MAPAAGSDATPVEAPTGRPRRSHVNATRKSALYLVGGLLLLAAIPVVATVRILDQSALRNSRARADASLRLELESSTRRVGELSDDAAASADDFVRSPQIAETFIRRDVPAIKKLARAHPNLVFRLDGRTVAGRLPRAGITRTVWLTVNGQRIGSIVGALPLDQALADRVLREGPHGPSDTLYIVRDRTVVGTKMRYRLDHATVLLGDKRFRALLTPVQNGHGAQLLAVRPVSVIDAGVWPYRQRIRFAALGSFALLALLSMLFARPILRTLSDFRRVASQATTDSLTGLANRRSFDEELTLEWRRSERIGGTLALILVDIDDFKQVNDTHGHQVGDAVLKKVGEVLGGRVRQLDVAARYGGEEFAVLLPETDVVGARTLAQRLRKDIVGARLQLPDGSDFGVTASFGVAEKNGFHRAEEMIAAADRALYDAKNRGKNRVATRRAEAAAVA